MIEVMDQLAPSVLDSFVHVAHSESVSFHFYPIDVSEPQGECC